MQVKVLAGQPLTHLMPGVTVFIIQWSEMALSNEQRATFQTQLYANGTIVFAYQNVSRALIYEGDLGPDWLLEVS